MDVKLTVRYRNMRPGPAKQHKKKWTEKIREEQKRLEKVALFGII